MKLLIAVLFVITKTETKNKKYLEGWKNAR